MPEVLAVVAAFVVSLVLTLYLRRYALKYSLLDLPNHRSSHTLPTPRGGGLAIVVVFVVATIALAFLAGLEERALWAVLGGGVMVAAISYWDDHGHVPARWRFAVHLLAAAWAVAWLGGVAPLNFGWFTVEPGWLGGVAMTLLIVWLLNLYNFMDGIDGIAAGEAVSVAFAMALISLFQGDSVTALWLAFLAAAAAGFLVWNWPPAKIFMGDVGSGFLGFVFAALALYCHNRGVVTIWAWLIILGVFIVDASLTLARRILAGEKWYQAHRSHAYQWASRQLGSHKAVSGAVLAINGVWLFPLAWYTAAFPEKGWVVLLLAYAPLLLLAWHFKAGRCEAPTTQRDAG